MSESGVVAVNVGMDAPVIADFVTGFIDGAQAYDPDIKIVKGSRWFLDRSGKDERALLNTGKRQTGRCILPGCRRIRRRSFRGL